MKAIILDYRDGTINIMPIPKEWEENADEFIRAHPCYDESSCYYMIAQDDTIEVYKIVEVGKDKDGYPNYDYQNIATL